MPTSPYQDAVKNECLSQAVIDEINRLGSTYPAVADTPDELLNLRPEMPSTQDYVQSLRKRLASKIGFSIISSEGIPQEYKRLCFAVLGMTIAEPIMRYGFLYAVTDRGESYLNKSIPVSLTRADTGMHTDSSAYNCIPGVVGLLCERTSLSGGSSRVVSAEAVCGWLAENNVEAYRLLCQSYIRDVVTPGIDKDLDTLKRNSFPVLSPEPEFEFRYMRYWIEKGHERAGVPLSPETLRAFDELDNALAKPEFGASFRLTEGDMLFVDNRRMVHGRDAYEDDSSGGRLLWRMWLDEKTRHSAA